MTDSIIENRSLSSCLGDHSFGVLLPCMLCDLLYVTLLLRVCALSGYSVCKCCFFSRSTSTLPLPLFLFGLASFVLSLPGAGCTRTLFHSLGMPQLPVLLSSLFPSLWFCFFFTFFFYLHMKVVLFVFSFCEITLYLLDLN